MDKKLLQKLKGWRKDMAQKEGVAVFRIFHNATLETIASLKPRTKEELMSIKGIRERKFEKYGANILALVDGGSEINKGDDQEKEGKEKKTIHDKRLFKFS